MTRTLTWLAATALLALWCLGCTRSAPSTTRPKVDRTDQPGEGAESGFPEELPEEALARISRWLESDRSSAAGWPSRDIFQTGGAESSPAPTEASRPPRPMNEEQPTGIELPRLTGFIFRGGTVDRPLAAIHFEGRMWLAGVGDAVGPFRVNSMIEGEEVELVDPDRGESLRLTIR